jgi:hypothetical protein
MVQLVNCGDMVINAAEAEIEWQHHTIPTHYWEVDVSRSHGHCMHKPSIHVVLEQQRSMAFDIVGVDSYAFVFPSPFCR